MAGSGYVLGNLSNEIERLGFQHELLGEGFRALWSRGGIGAGTQVLDAGCGPGYASLELAQIVGDTGQVIALDFTSDYLKHLRTQIAANSLHNIMVVESDLHRLPLPDACCDAIFVKFVLLFISDLDVVLREFYRVLRPGGRLLICDYCASGYFSPPETSLNELFDFFRQHYKGGADIEVARVLPRELLAQNFQLTSIVPEAQVGRMGDRVWQWTKLFIEATLDRFAQDGDIPQAKVDNYRQELTKLAHDPTVFYVAPLILQLVANKPC